MYMEVLPPLKHIYIYISIILETLLQDPTKNKLGPLLEFPTKSKQTHVRPGPRNPRLGQGLSPSQRLLELGLLSFHLGLHRRRSRCADTAR